MMMVAKDERSGITSPTWYLARASTTSPVVPDCLILLSHTKNLGHLYHVLSPKAFAEGLTHWSTNGDIINFFVQQGSLEIADVKPSVMLTESQMILKNDLELIKAQLHAQTKAFQALSHSITLLEQESNQQQNRIKELEEEVQFASHSTHGETVDGLMQRRIQEVWRAMAKEVEGLQGSMIQKENSMENLSQEVLESKKFLWEELEAVQSELRRIHQKLKDQEVDITRNLVSIKKMQENQMKCTKILSQLRGKIPENTSEIVDNKPVSEELNDIW
ncbi:hypothetical protein JD844_010123 [Phrynosoma platyrhinos]|uniref:Uncharacterized protein n=1 Tax=Phrynosoma platyrhinos TaxID=52577 RepID=A0ABQ7TGV5_PHRPL|nr:hypothetical protein JD844_010123 [Phrynosoma platyrhinos]